MNMSLSYQSTSENKKKSCRVLNKYLRRAVLLLFSIQSVNICEIDHILDQSEHRLSVLTNLNTARHDRLVLTDQRERERERKANRDS